MLANGPNFCEGIHTKSGASSTGGSCPGPYEGQPRRCMHPINVSCRPVLAWLFMAACGCLIMTWHMPASTPTSTLWAYYASQAVSRGHDSAGSFKDAQTVPAKVRRQGSIASADQAPPFQSAVAGATSSFGATSVSAAAPAAGSVKRVQPAGALPFSLFLSLAPPSEHFGWHHAEILAAVRANALSGVFREVIIWYEETHNQTCGMLLAELARGITPLEHILAENRNRLRCWPRLGGQPSYGELFSAVLENTRLGGVQTEAVVIATSDVVFEHSLGTLLPLRPGDLHTLTVNGVASDMADTYCAMMRQPAGCYVPKTKAIKWQPRDCGIDRNGRRLMPVFSWDAYAFNVSSSREPALGIPVAKMNFSMNILGAENRAVCMLVLAGWMPYNHCHTVRVIHFHGAPKTHVHNAQPISPERAVLCKAGDFVVNRFFSKSIKQRVLVQVPFWV